MSDARERTWRDSEVRRRLLKGLGYKGEKAYRSLRDAGYGTPDDLSQAHPREIKQIPDVGKKTLIILNETVDGFHAHVPDQYREDSEPAEITSCPNCDAEVRRERLGHHLRKCVSGGVDEDV